MKQSAFVAISALFLTSCLVRILPAFLSVRLGPLSQYYLERILPVAVFINFIVYIAYTEALRDPAAALVSLTIVAGIAFLDLFGLISAAGVGTVLYFLLTV